MQVRIRIVAACIAAAAMQPVVLQACGYDNPQSIALGSLNWAYPDALYVRTAVSEAEASGLLPARDLGGPPNLFAFHRATTAMKLFGNKLSSPNLAEAGTTISVVLIPQALWTRITFGPEGASVQGHVEGPDERDVVLVTEEKVVRALLDGKIDAPTAEKNGLVRYYGNPADISDVRGALANATLTN